MVMMSAQHYNPRHDPFGKPDRSLFVFRHGLDCAHYLWRKTPNSHWWRWAQPLSLRGFFLEDEGERCLSFPFPLATQQPSNAS